MDSDLTLDQSNKPPRKRRSRMTRKKTGRRIQLTERDIRTLQLLSRYRFLRSTHLHALAGGRSQKRFVERLGDLFHECGYINRPKQQWQAINARYMPAVYELTKAGARLLEEYGVGPGTGELPTAKHQREPARQFHHELMICDILASIEIGTRADPSLRFIPWPQILGSASMPDATRQAPNPKAVDVSITYTPPRSGRSFKFNRPLIPDAVFGLEYTTGGQRRYRFFALEADRNTEPIVRSDPKQSSYFRKILQYRQIIARSEYKTHWGLPNLFVLTVTTNDRHRQNIMRLVKKLTTGGNTSLLFRTMPSLASLERAPQPVPDMLTEPWHRVGHPDFPIDRP